MRPASAGSVNHSRLPPHTIGSSPLVSWSSTRHAAMPNWLSVWYASGCFFALIQANELAVVPVPGAERSSSVTSAPRRASR